ncbi:alpha-galactosidase [Olivibacter ginsenosidimutans]|uniref:Alpha-galactosidase n=1 Tax=Olivibacter ginsenosidimutans TaxID=1176537 RepID=A0ABP9C290_9SPHI
MQLVYGQEQLIIQTDQTTLVFTIGKDKKLYQSYLGARLNPADYAKIKDIRHEAYHPAGTDNLFEPAIQVLQADGNPSLDLRYQKHDVQQVDGHQQTIIELRDPQYPVKVNLILKAFPKESIITSSVTIENEGKKPVVLKQYASSMLHLDAPNYWLTQFHGDWAAEMRMDEVPLNSGIKIIDSKLGARADMYQSPVFYVAEDKPASETTGKVLAGTLAWTGNFRFAFEVDNHNSLRIISGINNYNSEWPLAAGEQFNTPAFIFTFSDQGKGQASRNLHDWARNYAVLDGKEPRLTLLNNWEATGMKFDQQKLVHLFDNGVTLGVDLFLLDDGWFGRKYPRDNDHTSLGDWQEDPKKLPDGLGYLAKAATDKGIKFGVWLEPEMVSPKSELYEKHPDWILKLPNRDEHYYRNQLVLDLTNPKVQDFVYDVVDKTLSIDQHIAYVKWDCNRMMTNTYSPYLKHEQSKVAVAYVQGLYKVLDRLRQKYPHLPMMLCSGGGGRTDYGGLKYFTEFWPSDNTDGLERIFIQWGYSNFFPANTIAAHITSWGKQPLKFRTDVAMMGKLGYDIEVGHMNEQELAFSKLAVATYKQLSPIIWQGDLYRLLNPYEQPQAALMYVAKQKNEAVVFQFDWNTERRNKPAYPVLLQGLDAKKQYRVEEVNLMPDSKSRVDEHGGAYSGDYLMKVGLHFNGQHYASSVVKISTGEGTTK